MPTSTAETVMADRPQAIKDTPLRDDAREEEALEFIELEPFPLALVQGCGDPR